MLRKAMLRKAQSDAMRYVIIAAVIIVITIFGFSAVMKVQQKLCKADITHFKILLSELDKGIQPGSSKNMLPDVPCGADEVYFFDLNESIDFDLLSDNPLLRDSIAEQRADRNLFLLKDGELLDSFYVGDVELKYPYFVCMLPRSDKIDFAVEGKSGAVSIAPGCEQMQCGFLPNKQDDAEAVVRFDIAKRFGQSTYCVNCPPDITTEYAKYIQTKENLEMTRMYDFCSETGLTHITIRANPLEGAEFSSLRFYEWIPKECAQSLQKDLETLENNLDNFEWEIVSDSIFMWELKNLKNMQQFSYTLNKSLSDYCLKNMVTIAAANAIENGKVVSVPEMPLPAENKAPAANTPPIFQLPTSQEIQGKLGVQLVIPKIYSFAKDKETNPQDLGYSVVSQTRPEDVFCEVKNNEQLLCTVLQNEPSFSDITLEAFDGYVSVQDGFRLRIDKYIPPVSCGNGACDGLESCTTCKEDCGSCSSVYPKMYLKCGINPMNFCKPAPFVGECPPGSEQYGSVTSCGVARKQFTCYQIMYTSDCTPTPVCPTNGIVFEERPCNW